MKNAENGMARLIFNLFGVIIYKDNNGVTLTLRFLEGFYEKNRIFMYRSDLVYAYAFFLCGLLF